ncbi:hypothetical protein DFH07DRAFT_730031 [Mycena maculata]|uniref:GATA-type domain-containing protein n=1 Tax=Mycena maculata TaxID=230809 RepID=A0AAD7NY76_9AGAR|nr:hypothetical protein DFH07DRAFT_730031 [Mycena maculata]
MSSILDARHRLPTPPAYASYAAPAPSSHSSKPSPPGSAEFTFAAGAQDPRGRVPCINCQTVDTPLWRRTPEGNPICNACDPQPDAAAAAAEGSESGGGQARRGGKINALACGNCGTSTTPLWRRDDVGNNICNACGLYFKLHGTHRPTSMKKTVIKRRKRVPAAGAGEGNGERVLFYFVLACEQCRADKADVRYFISSCIPMCGDGGMWDVSSPLERLTP